MTAYFWASMTATRFAAPSATKASLRSLVIFTPTGPIASFGSPWTENGMVWVTLRGWAVLSTTLTLPPTSALTQTSASSAVNWA